MSNEEKISKILELVNDRAGQAGDFEFARLAHIAQIDGCGWTYQETERAQRLRILVMALVEVLGSGT